MAAGCWVEEGPYLLPVSAGGKKVRGVEGWVSG